METVDVGVDDKRCVLSFDRSAAELASCRKSDFSFSIVPSETESGKSVAVFEIRKDGEVVRRNTSKPFPTGSLVENGGKRDVNSKNCNVVLKKHDPSINLHHYFP